MGNQGTTDSDHGWRPGEDAPPGGDDGPVQVTGGSETPGASRLGYAAPGGAAGKTGSRGQTPSGDDASAQPGGHDARERRGDQPGADRNIGDVSASSTGAGGGKPLSGTDTDATAGEANQTSMQGKPPAPGTPGSIGTMGGTDRSETPGI